jgi:hypothetical protein
VNSHYNNAHTINPFKKSMKRFYILILVCAMTTGCSVSRAIDSQLAQMDRSNGLNYQEAVIVAQDTLRMSPAAPDYDVKSGKVIQGLLVRGYPDHWFVTFDAKDFRTPFWKFMVVMHKDTGEIIFSESCIPLDHANFDWVFQPHKVR